MAHHEDIRELANREGGILVRLRMPFPQPELSDHVVSAEELLIANNAIGYVVAWDDRAHVSKVKKWNREGDEWAADLDHNQFQLVLSPMWLPEHRIILADWMKKSSDERRIPELKELFDALAR